MNKELKALASSRSEDDRKKAIPLFKEYLAQNPGDAEAWYKLACCPDFIGEEEAAEGCYQKTYDLDWKKLPLEDQKSFFVGFGSTLRNTKKFERSAEVLRMGTGQFPDYPALKVFLALTYYSQQKDREAVQVLFKGILDCASKGLDGYERAIGYYVDEISDAKI